ncbi:hypothetical protein HYH03_004840 [Edaphochlamys debaryana]|uniref:phytol kinase n=1 Tax=Edaphochlamys debaryana TaxID=47281 RepID=A0A835YAI7_9CHLO|nr:hypothetical protein HYH03_004840 [Edaphochlamys debaryana]|eukprot:KAG2497256.1 hypothetical protein HYH03_004840 [Edaphochlamys debaryana]
MYLWKVASADDLPGLAALFGLALRRSCAALSEGIPADLRSAYVSLRSTMSTALAIGFECKASEARLCSALLRGHVLRCYAAALDSCTNELLAQRPNPPWGSISDARSLLLGAYHTLRAFIWAAKLQSASSEVEASLLDLGSQIWRELAASGLLEHWARLAIAIVDCQGRQQVAQEESFKANLLDLATRPGCGLPGPITSYLLTSHLVTLATALDGGPTYGLPLEADAAAAGSGPGPSTSAGGGQGAAPEPSATVLQSTPGGVLQPHEIKPARVSLALAAVRLWRRTLRNLASLVAEDLGERGEPRVEGMPKDLLPAPPPPPEAWPPGRFAWRAVSRVLERARAAGAAAAGAGGDPDGGPGSGAQAALRSHAASVTQRCEELLPALTERGQVMLSPTVAFEVGMRLAGAGSLQVDRIIVEATGEGVTQKEPSLLSQIGFRAGAQQLRQPWAKLSFDDAQALMASGLELARSGLEVLLGVYGAQDANGVPAWVKQRLSLYWSSACLWARIFGQRQGESAGPALALHPRVCTGGPPSCVGPDAQAAVAAGYVDAIDGLLQRRKASLACVDQLFPRAHDGMSVWAEVILLANPHATANLAATIARQLHRLARTSSSEEDEASLVTFARAASSAFTLGSTLPAALVGYTGGLEINHMLFAMLGVAAAVLPAAGSALRSVEAVALLGSGRCSSRVAEAAVDLASLLLCWVPTLLAASHPPVRSAGMPGEAVLEAAAEAVRASEAPSAAGSDSAASPAAEGEGEGENEGMPEPDSAWCDLLRSGVGLSRLLGTAMRALCAVELASTTAPLRQPLRSALWALVARAPQLLAAEVAAAEVRLAAAGTGGEGGGTGGPPAALTLDLLRRTLREGGAMPEPELLAAVEAVCSGEAAGAEAGAGAGPSGSAVAASRGGGSGGVVLPEEVRLYAVAIPLLQAYKHAGALLPGCSYPPCTNLAAPGGAPLQLKPCGGGCGGAARYCSRECQVAHWREGHKEECQAAAARKAASLAAAGASD